MLMLPSETADYIQTQACATIQAPEQETHHCAHSGTMHMISVLITNFAMLTWIIAIADRLPQDGGVVESNLLQPPILSNQWNRNEAVLLTRSFSMLIPLQYS